MGEGLGGSDETFYFYSWGAEVNEEAKIEVGGFEVVHALGKVLGVQCCDCFQFYNHGLFNE